MVIKRKPRRNPRLEPKPRRPVKPKVQYVLWGKRCTDCGFRYPINEYLDLQAEPNPGGEEPRRQCVKSKDGKPCESTSFEDEYDIAHVMC